MKLPILLIGCLLSPAFLQAQETEQKPIFDPSPSGLDKYGKLLEKDPFDFDKEAVPPPPPTPPMEGWLLAGITKTEDYQTAILVNLKTSERLRLNHYQNPPSKRANTTIHGGDKYELVSIDFEDGEPRLKNASAVISKNGERTKVEYSDEILKMKPAAAPPGQPGANIKGMQNQPGAIPNPNVRPAQPGAAPAAGGSSNAELIKMLQKQRGENPGGTPAASGGTNPASTAPGTGSNPAQPGAVPPQPRRRVVLPTEAAPVAPAAPPPPAAPAPAAPAPAAPAPAPGN